MTLHPGSGRRVASVSGDFKLTMPEFLFLFGRRPSDVRWLELADRMEKQKLLAYFIRRIQPQRGAA
jgi:hypothetical protein